MKNDILKHLKKEHDEVNALLKEAEVCAEKDRTDILEQIERNLIPHARGEEKTLYSLMRKRAQNQDKEESLDLSNEAYEEHRVVDKLLSELKNLDTSSEQWLAHLKVFKENIEHHVEEEETELFDKAKNLVTDKERDELLGVYLDEKERFSESLPPQSQIKERVPAPSVSVVRNV